MKKIINSAFITLTILIVSCNKDEGPFYPATSVLPDTVLVSYSKDIQSIFNSSCVSCHSELHAKLNLKSCCSYEQLFETGFSASYIDTVTPQNSRLYKHITGVLSVMPPSGKLPDEQINKIMNWIDQGGKNN